MGIPTIDMPAASSLADSFDIVLDGIFGFSFSGAVRAPFDEVLASIKSSGVPVVAIDIPSGWSVEDGMSSLRCCGVVQHTQLLPCTILLCSTAAMERRCTARVNGPAAVKSLAAAARRDEIDMD